MIVKMSGRNARKECLYRSPLLLLSRSSSVAELLSSLSSSRPWQWYKCCLRLDSRLQSYALDAKSCLGAGLHSLQISRISEMKQRVCRPATLFIQKATRCKKKRLAPTCRKLSQSLLSATPFHSLPRPANDPRHEAGEGESLSS